MGEERQPDRPIPDAPLPPPLTGYWHASELDKPISDTHGHYREDRERAIPVIHTHQAGKYAHFHEEGAYQRSRRRDALAEEDAE